MNVGCRHKTMKSNLSRIMLFLRKPGNKENRPKILKIKKVHQRSRSLSMLYMATQGRRETIVRKGRSDGFRSLRKNFTKMKDVNQKKEYLLENGYYVLKDNKKVFLLN